MIKVLVGLGCLALSFIMLGSSHWSFANERTITMTVYPLEVLRPSALENVGISERPRKHDPRSAGVQGCDLSIGKRKLIDDRIGVTASAESCDRPWRRTGADVHAGADYPPFLSFAKVQAAEYPNVSGWRRARVDKLRSDLCGIAIENEVASLSANISSYLPLTYVAGDINSGLRSAIGLARKAESPNQQAGSYRDKNRGEKRVEGHVLGGLIHRLRSFVHALLGDKIIYLALAGFGFAALSGLSGFIVFDDLNRERNRQLIGRGLLISCPVLVALCLLLGLP